MPIQPTITPMMSRDYPAWRHSKIILQYNDVIGLLRSARQLYITSGRNYYSSPICVRECDRWLPRFGWETGFCQSFDPCEDENGLSSPECKVFKEINEHLREFKENIDGDADLLAEYHVEEAISKVIKLGAALRTLGEDVNHYIHSRALGDFKDEQEMLDARELEEQWLEIVPEIVAERIEVPT